tara:strand:+ start:236 stop:424 length:189 start_codon:yes stop_codon:yes gene_type:complete
MHQTVLRINKKSFSNGNDYHVGMKGLDVTLTCKPGWIFKTEILGVDDQGHTKLHVYSERVDK